jgi:WD40 repeat protein
MQHSLAIEPLPQFAAHQSNNIDSQPSSSSGQPAQPLCGAFDALTCCLLLGCSSGTVSCIHLGRYGSTARRVLGRHAGRVTAACLFPWQAPEHIAAAATVVPCARVASFFATCSADASIKIWTSDAKALHTTDACLQTLRGHRATVTSLASVQVSRDFDPCNPAGSYRVTLSGFWVAICCFIGLLRIQTRHDRTWLTAVAHVLQPQSPPHDL